MRCSLLLSVLLLASCHSLISTDINSPYYRIPVGSQLVLERELELAPEQVSLYIQNGSIFDPSQLDRYHAYCKFEMWSRVDRKRVVSPGEFEITRVSQDYELVRLPDNRPVRLAALDMAGIDDSGPMAVIDKTFLYLHSDKESDVYRITCEHWSRIIESRPLMVAEIRKTLEGMFTLQIRVGANQ
jgi:hypothetical protein